MTMMMVMMMMIIINFSVLKSSFLYYYLERDVKLNYLNGDTEIPIFRTDLREAVDTASLNHQNDVFSDDKGRWERSRIKHLKYVESVDNSTEKVLDENEKEYNKIWNIKRCIHYHHESRDFHRVIIFIEQKDFIFVQYYFDDDEHPVNTFKRHGNSRSSKKIHKRTKESVKLSVRNSSVGPKETASKNFKEAGGYLDVRSCSDFPRDRKQVTNLKYSKKHQLVEDDIIELIDMCTLEKTDEKFIRNIIVTPEKIVSLMNDRQLSDIKRFCTSNKAISILGVDSTYNIGPCFVTITTYRHLQFLTKENVHPVMLGPTIIHARKEYQSYFSLPSDMLRLEPKIAGMRVFGSDSEKKFHKQFSNLFPTAIHLLCDLHMKDNIQNKLKDLQFRNCEKEEILADTFGKKRGDYIKKGLVDSESVEEFDGCYQELKRKWIAFEDKGEKLLSYLENGKTKMRKNCMRGELRSISGLGFLIKY